MEVVYWPQYPPAAGKQQVERNLEQAIEHFNAVMMAQRGVEAKIGITNDPKRREKEHSNRTLVQRVEERDGEVIIEVYVKGYWSHMHVIYQTQSADQIRSAEKQFVERARALRHVLGNVEVTPINAIGGGGGPVSRQGPYYLYILRKEDVLHGGRNAGGS